ncbi:hypothetical protein FIBSPDRAFT_896305 [Athelia psychrophila]|uniref:Uncharacterized protein n=1 Tax=Athelia psychrophila TaxID=1759441 RepID=A0A166DK54_9AGAM|nr:hypothetical protein FIBSPDRAFT_896305 [Fibularhizoctonia sp. CBS 109695]
MDPTPASSPSHAWDQPGSDINSPSSQSDHFSRLLTVIPDRPEHHFKMDLESLQHRSVFQSTTAIFVESIINSQRPPDFSTHRTGPAQRQEQEREARRRKGIEDATAKSANQIMIHRPSISASYCAFSWTERDAPAHARGFIFVWDDHQERTGEGHEFGFGDG